jgi:asparagine synthase (glutamine-hydrolysing)
VLQEICSKLEELVVDAVSHCKSDCIALSGGLDSSILAFCLNGKIRSIVTIAENFPSTDLMYSQLVAKQIGLQLDVNNASITELTDAIEETIKILKVFNPIEIRNSIVMYITLKTAKEKGCKSMITGDGADELFAGYSFFLRKQGAELQKDLERIWKIMHFPTQSLGKSIGLGVESPFLNEKVAEYAKSIPADLKVHDERGTKHGKWILRKAFEKRLPESITWRKKSPLQDGSGTSGLTSFFDNVVADSVFKDKMQMYLEKEKVRLGSKEALCYYELYRKYHEPPINLGTSKSRCPECQAVKELDSHFCRMCGSFPI